MTDLQSVLPLESSDGKYTFFDGFSPGSLSSEDIVSSASSVSSDLKILSDNFTSEVHNFESWRKYYIEKFDAYSICLLLYRGVNPCDFPEDTKERYKYLSEFYDFDSFIDNYVV